MNNDEKVDWYRCWVMLRILATPSAVDLLQELGLGSGDAGKIHDLAVTFDPAEAPDPSMSRDVLKSCDRLLGIVKEKFGARITELLSQLQEEIPSTHEARAATEWMEITTRLLRTSPADDPVLLEALASARPILSRHLAEHQRLVQRINSREKSISAADWGEYMRSRDFSIAAKILAIAETRQVRAMLRDLNSVMSQEQWAGLLGLAQRLRPDMASDLAALAKKT